MKKIKLPRLHSTTAPGYANANRQTVMCSTGAPSTTFPGQTIYKLECGSCRSNYGSNGVDTHHRRCPHCQQGKPGEPLRSGDNLNLFSE